MVIYAKMFKETETAGRILVYSRQQKLYSSMISIKRKAFP